MSRTKGSPPLTELEIQAAKRMREDDRLTWRKIGQILRRDYSGLNRACGYMKIWPMRDRTGYRPRQA